MLHLFTYGAKGWLATYCYFDKNTFCLGIILEFIFLALFQIHVIKCLYVNLGACLWYTVKREKKKSTPQLVSFCILKMSEQICSSLSAPSSPVKLTLTTGGPLLYACMPPPLSMHPWRLPMHHEQSQRSPRNSRGKQSGSVTLRMWKEMLLWQ